MSCRYHIFYSLFTDVVVPLVIGAHRAEVAAREDRRIKDELRVVQYYQDVVLGLRGDLAEGMTVTAAEHASMKNLSDSFVRRQSALVRSLGSSDSSPADEATVRRWVQQELAKYEAASERGRRALGRLLP